MATAGLLAHILTAKFCDALPFYRQEKQFARLGVELGRATMGNWAIKAATACGPVLALLHTEIRSGPLINIDETTVQVLDEPNRSPTTKSYMWVCRGGPPDKPVIIYRYAPSRSSTVAQALLQGTKGWCRPMAMSDMTILITTRTYSMADVWRMSGGSSMKPKKREARRRPRPAEPMWRCTISAPSTGLNPRQRRPNSRQRSW
ncbi:MAG: transposase [Desulfofustis sp. PB-SRB1]|nr:transposase [Desulfofustis sp. PB-SRB1]